MFYFIKVKRYDTVVARRVNRKGEPIIRSCFARQFYKIIRRMSKNNIVDGARVINASYFESIIDGFEKKFLNNLYP